jgi:hypothetical protein
VLGLYGLALAGGLAGCKETTSSENIRTRGIAMLTEVTARSDSHARVRTELVVGGDESNTYVILEGGDQLVAMAGDEEQVMEAVSDGIYETVFEIGEGGTPFMVMLEREGDDDAPDNEGTLPEPFEITSDFGDTPVSRADDSMEITWEPSGEDDDMDIAFEDVDESCIYNHDDDIPGDPGSYLVEPATLDSTDSDDPETCDVEVTITRTRDGSTDSALDGESSFVLRQVRRFTFVSDP